MKYVDKILSWLFGLDDINEWEAAYQELKKEYDIAVNTKQACEGEIRRLNEKYKRLFLNHNLVFGPYSCLNDILLLDEVVSGHFTYKLYKGLSIFKDRKGVDTYFIIQVAYENDDREYTIRLFSDTDTEYAENCAREAFEYLTKEI